MRKVLKKSIAFLLAFAMISATFLQAMPVQAAPIYKKMAHLAAGENNGNGHFAATAETGKYSPEAFVLSKDKEITNEDFSFKMKVGDESVTRFRFVTKYVDDYHWGYLAYQMGSNWMFEYRYDDDPTDDDNKSGYPAISGLPSLVTGDFVNISGTYTDEGLTVTVENVTQGTKETATVSNEYLTLLTAEEGQIGFGASHYVLDDGTKQKTEFWFSDVKVGEKEIGFDDFEVYGRTAEGYTWEEVDVVVGDDGQPEEGGKDEGDDVEPPVAASRKWIDLSATANIGNGHNYGNAASAGPLFYAYQDAKMTSGGVISMALKPAGDNWGVFYSYIDDNNWLYVGHDGNSGWYYQYKIKGAENYPKISGLPEFVAGEEMQLSICVDRETLIVTVNGTTVRVPNDALINLANTFTNTYGDLGKFGVMTKAPAISFADFKFGTTDCMDESKWAFNAERNGYKAEVSYTAVKAVSGKITDTEGNPVKGATVRIGANATTTDANGNYKFAAIQVGEYTFAVTKAGYQAYTDTISFTKDDENVTKDAAIAPKAALDLSAYDTIASDDMTVYIGKDFPVVARYTMNSDETGKTFFRGNETELNTVVINGTEFEPTVTVKEKTETSKTYTLEVSDSEGTDVVRLAGDGRIATSYMVADELKEQLGVDKFEAIIVVRNNDFADALTGSYLAVVKNAPIILTKDNKDTVDELCAYIKANLADQGTVYILGGENAVSANVEAEIEAALGYETVRLAGEGRSETNLAILEEAGIGRGSDLIVATNKEAWDSLSASALKKPILLVSKNATELTKAQEKVVDKVEGKIYIVGGETKVTAELEAGLKYVYGEETVERIAGGTRLETSKLVAEEFFKNVDTVVAACSTVEYDGLCGGPLAAAMNAPLLLTRDGKTEFAREYVQAVNPETGYVLGGTGALSNETVDEVFGSSEVKDAIDFTMDVKISVEANTLTWEVTELTKAKNCVKIATIDIPHLNLLTVDASEEDSVFAGAQASTTTTAKADTYITFADGFVPSNEDGYLYAFLTNGKLSAGLHSNSEKEGDKRIERINGADTMSLTSAVWYYESGDANRGHAQAAKYDYPLSELPQAKVAIANGDLNGDGDIDWNDGAIAFRDVMHVAQGSEAIKDMVNYRIVMNFESAAPNPFLQTADNVKKVYLATDGLPQALLLKGYGNEGHDSANSEYADIAEREGGVEDFQELIRIAHDYNTEVGIHVNAQEIYPEARSMSDAMITMDNGTINNTTWGWLDQSVEINKLWDLASDARYKRFVQLYDRINETDFLSLDWDEKEYVKDSQGFFTNGDGETKVSRVEVKELVKADAATRKDNMDFIYLDVWYQDAWETRRIAEEINSLGWRFSTEFSGEGEYDSTWQHWSTDTTYGGAGAKGFNSDIIRFLRNDQRDSQVLNWPFFGGTADNPLLGGFRLYGFEGWGGQQNFEDYIWFTFDENLPTKFLQHYEIIDWENYADGESPVGNTEKQITLANDEGDVVVVTRNEEQRPSKGVREGQGANTSNIDEIERTITLNGKVVLNTDTKEHTYLLPWIDNQNREEKLYHWNLDGGTTTWELQDDWSALGNVVVYELSDQGRGEGQIVAVTDGSIELTAKPATAYVVVKGEEAKAKELVKDFGEGENVVDPGFNGYANGAKLDAADWSGDITAEGVSVIRTNLGDQKLEMTNTADDVAVTTTISGLTAGEYYVAELYVANESDARATMTVVTGEKEVSVYTDRSIVQNYVSCDSEHGTKMNRMQVSFVAEGETATLTLSRTAGEGYTHWDDIRIVEQKADNYKEDGSFVQDFESVVQGLYPFVLGYNAGGDSRTHLSQLNAPYTQKGWLNKAVDDAIEGEWSLKHHSNMTGLAYRTIPQNFRFEPGKVYTVEFDYQTASAGYQMVVGDGTTYNLPTSYLPTATTTQHVTMQVVGSGSGQTWIGLYMNGSMCYDDTRIGTVDFILDNLVIKEDPNAVAVTVGATELFLGETTAIFGSGLDKITWSVSKEGIVSVDKENNKINAIGKGTVTVTASYGVNETEEFVINVVDGMAKDIARTEFANISATANTDHSEGRAPAAVDNNSETYWHSDWGAGFYSTPTKPAELTVDLGTTLKIGGFKFQQRNQANRVVTQYGYEIKDAEGNVLKSATGIKTNTGALDWVEVLLDKSVEARTIVFKVEGAHTDGHACLAEIAPIALEKVAAKAELTDAAVKAGETVTLTATPVEGDVLKGLVWISSDETVATVNQKGVVTGVAAGTATITLSNATGTLATCTITVE